MKKSEWLCVENKAHSLLDSLPIKLRDHPRLVEARIRHSLKIKLEQRSRSHQSFVEEKES